MAEVGEEGDVAFPSSLCKCSEKKGIHVHCQCSNCKGKAVVRRTQLNHLRLEAKKRKLPSENPEVTSSTSSDTTTQNLTEQVQPYNIGKDPTVASFMYVENPSCSSLNYAEQPMSDNDDDSSINEDEVQRDGDDSSINEDEVQRDVNMDAIVHAIFYALECLDQMKGSLKSFEDLLYFARAMYCKGAQINPLDENVMKQWPKTWNEAKKVLSDLGYSDAKEYFICLSDEHPCQWDILESKNDVCRHCENNPTIPYYYFGLKAKVKLWVCDKSMCHKMTAHWREKEHWLGRDEGWHTKKELWDGDRFAELSWFFDSKSKWCLPVRCRTEACKNIISGDTIESLQERPDGMKEIMCEECHSSFMFRPKYTVGDPRNIALIAHWDGFQPFGSNRRSAGAIEVAIATMSKLDRANTQEVYTVGFVPSYLLPDKRANSLDPFLDPLVTDLENGFIEGFRVSYEGDMLDFPYGEITIRLLLLLWTGDHPAQCEICKSKGSGGKYACRRCKLLGEYLAAQKHYYYPGFRKNYRFPIEKREIMEELPAMEEIEQEERVTVAGTRSRESGFTGLSQLHRLYPLYKFDVLQDLVFDVMHLVPLNLVKRRLEYFLTNLLVDEKDLQTNLDKMPWTREYRKSRLPADISQIGRWKAEEFQKFAYPSSEFVLEGNIDPSDKVVWAPLPRIVEYIFSSGLNGWSRDMIDSFKRLCWRYCILVQESYGTAECLITLHSLTHVPEDIIRFSSPDNYWCFQYERAVGRYIKQTSNKKGVERTFMRKETQREFLKTWPLREPLPLTGKYNQEKMVATSIEAARELVKLSEADRDHNARAQIGILVGKGNNHMLSREEILAICACLQNSGFNENMQQHLCMAETYKSSFVPTVAGAFSETVYQIGDDIIGKLGNNETVIKILHIYLLNIHQQYIPVIMGDFYRTCRDSEGIELRHPFGDTLIVEPYGTNACLSLSHLSRKVMLYPQQAGKFALIDQSRSQIHLPNVLVPAYVQVGDMVHVRGDDDKDLWRAEIRAVDYDQKFALGYFYVKHRLWQQNSLWIRESQARAMDKIVFQSIVGIVSGQWHGVSWKDI